MRNWMRILILVGIFIGIPGMLAMVDCGPDHNYTVVVDSDGYFGGSIVYSDDGYMPIGGCGNTTYTIEGSYVTVLAQGEGFTYDDSIRVTVYQDGEIVDEQVGNGPSAEVSISA